MTADKNKIRIGLVDDHQMILDGLEKLINSVENYEVVFTENRADQVLKNLENQEIDLLITDVAMPGMNGAELVQKIRQLDHPIKILVLSMYHTDLVDESLIDGYILKESSSEEILDKIKNTIEKNSNKKFDVKSRQQSILSKREAEIVVEIGNGLSSEQIAEKLFLSYYTVETHKKNIFLKLNVKTVGELIKKAMFIGIIR